MVLKINFVKLFFYGLLGTLLSVSGIDFFNQTMTYCLVFALVFLIEGEVKREMLVDLELEDEAE